jgi:hypothetical protein
MQGGILPVCPYKYYEQGQQGSNFQEMLHLIKIHLIKIVRFIRYKMDPPIILIILVRGIICPGPFILLSHPAKIKMFSKPHNSFSFG